MRRQGIHIGWLLGVCAVSGCLNPMTTRLPTWNAGSPEAEKKSYEQFDPFPDVNAGPNTYSRPRGYTQQREPSRRAIEFNQTPARPSVPGYPIYPGYPGPDLGTPNSGLGSDYPNVVTP
ncbi:MAG: hypothetical protein WEB58_08205 [Planctomycetaceae bacterium]